MTKVECRVNASDEEIFDFDYEVISDEALEAACDVANSIPTVLHSSYCFACPE
jgi:hypothetical protein